MPTLADIAQLLKVPLPPGAEAGRTIAGIDTLADAGPDKISFVSTDAYAKAVSTSKAAAVIAKRRIELPADVPMPVMLVDDADLAVAQLLPLFAPPIPRPTGIDPSARVAPDARVGEGAAVGFSACIGNRVVIGKRTILHAGVFVGDDTVIGDDCELFPKVVVRERVTLGNRVIIHAGSILGSDGFGYRWDGTKHVKVPQIGTVVIEDDVEIGSCVCVDRAKFGVTLIGRGSKIDNLVQVAHNVKTGPHCIVAGQAGMAGSVTLGAGVVLGGQSAVRDHVVMADGSILAGSSGVMDDVPAKTIVSGLPALPHRQSMREQAALRDLPNLRVQIRKLIERIDALEQKNS